MIIPGFSLSDYIWVYDSIVGTFLFKALFIDEPSPVRFFERVILLRVNLNLD